MVKWVGPGGRGGPGGPGSPEAPGGPGGVALPGLNSRQISAAPLRFMVSDLPAACGSLAHNYTYT